MSFNIKSRATRLASHMRYHWIGVLGVVCVGSGLMGYTSGENSVAQASILKATQPMLLATPRPILADLIPEPPTRSTVSVSLKAASRDVAQPMDQPLVPEVSAMDAPTPLTAPMPKTGKDRGYTPSATLVTTDKTQPKPGPEIKLLEKGLKPLEIKAAKPSPKVATDKTTPQEPRPAVSQPLAKTKPKPVRKTHKLADYQIPVIVRSGDSLARIMSKQSFDPEVVQEILSLGKTTSVLKRLHPGDKLFIGRDKDKQLSRLDYSIGPFKSLQIRRINKKLSAKLIEHPKTIRIREASGTIQSSFYEATRKAGISPGLSITLANIFEWDIDFAQNLRKGDTFSIIYEEYLKNGKPAGTGNILAAEFTNRGTSHRAIRFQAGDSVGYYDANGRPLRKAFLRTPVKYSHISSRFTRKRWHPVLKRWRAHRGVDYAASRGTPIRATGRGTIKTIGKMRGYGNVVMIQHANKRLTVYGHMEGFARKLKRGSRVQQGQIIGYVGSTGYATGPHLHYEFRVNNKHRDPLRVALPKASPLPRRWMDRFREQSEPLLAQLNGMQQPTVVAQRD